MKPVSEYSHRMAIRVTIAAGVVSLLFWAPIQSQELRPQSPVRDPGVRPGAAAAGSPIPGLTSGQLAAFREGLDTFEEVVFVHNPPPGGDAGLGPGFNADSCASCHAFPATGGSSPTVNPQVAVATKLGARNRIPGFIRADGPVLEVRFKRNRDGSPDGGVHNLFVITGRSDAPGCNAQQEDFSNAGNLAFRIPTPTFGLGLVEAIPDTTLRRNLANNSALKAALGISGRLNTNGNDGTVTRFGWKAQNKSLLIFAAEAYNVESGVTNQLFPQERNETAGCQFNPTPEDFHDLNDDHPSDVGPFSEFMRLLAPPARGPINDSVRNGAEIFTRIGCALCHTPSLQTGANAIPALSAKSVDLYSDLALHDMGPGLADDIQQGGATGSEFRTAPLWGLGQRIFLLHDGRTKNLIEAIRAHALPSSRPGRPSEATQVIRLYDQLTNAQEQDLLHFLRSL